VVLEILVDADKGIVELRQFDKALQDTTKATQQQTQAQHQGTQSSTSFASSLAQSTKAAAGLAAGFAGVAGIATTLGAAATAATGFEAALNAISALGTVSTGQLSKLREQLLALPPALGSSTELAKGLYDILGANVPADNAITVLTRSAELAKGGLGNLDTAINAVTKSAAAFGIPLEQAQYVTDVFTQTVVRGQGRLEEFAQAFPQVAATAAATGASFIDTNAAIAVLTQTFKNADTAATGLNSFFQQLIQNSAKFAAEGINVKQVLAEEGLTGIFRRLNEVTGGSAERLKELINDSEGFRAALTLTGTQFETFNETVGSYANVTGLAQQAASKNLAGAGAAWQTFINTLDRLVQEVAPPLLSAFTSITGAAATLAADVTKLWRAFTQSETLRTITADMKAFLVILGETSVVQGFVTSLKDLNDSLLTAKDSTDKTYNAFEVLDQLLQGNIVPTIDFVKGAWDLMNAAFNATVAVFLRFATSVVQVVTPLAELVAALDQTATKLGLSDGRLSKLGEKAKDLSKNLEEAAVIFDEQAQGFVLGTHRMGEAQEKLGTQLGKTTDGINTQSQTLPQQQKAAEGAAKATEQLSASQQAAKAALDAAGVAATAFQGALEKIKPGDILNAMPTAALGNAVTLVTQSLEKMAASGKFSAREISQAYEDAASVLRERFGELPPVFQKAYDAFLEKTRKTASDVGLIFARLGIETKEAQQKSAAEFTADVAALLGQTKGHVESTLALTKDANGRMVIASKEAASAVQEEWKEGMEGVTKTTSVTVQDQIKLLHEMVDRINRGEFKQIPKDWEAALAVLGPIAQKNGEGVVKIFRDVNGNLKAEFQETATSFKTHGLTFEKVFAAVTAAEMEFGNNLRDHLSPALIKAAEDMGLLGKRTEETEKNTKGLSTTAIQLGHYINELGEEVNAYGNAIARLSDETQRLMDLQVSFETTFASDVSGLLAQLAQTQQEILSLGSSVGGSAAMQAQIAGLNEQMAAITKRLLALGVDQYGRPLAGTGTGTTATGTTTTTTGTTTTGTRPTGGGSGFAPTAPMAPTGPSGGSLVIGGGTTRPGSGIPETTTQRTATYNLVIQTQAQDAATLARDLVPYLRQADLSSRRMGS